MPKGEPFDPDIAALGLSEVEKNGLQVFRNYQTAFDEHARKKFVAKLDVEPLDTSKLEKLVRLLITEELRFLPVVLCGYGDEHLKHAFEATIPDGVPGGVGDMLGGYGPLGDLSKRIRMAYAFDVVSQDTMATLDSIRRVRNRIAHDWEQEKFENFHTEIRSLDFLPLNVLFEDKAHLGDLSTISAAAAFRIRLIWLAGRLTYEASAWPMAKAARLDPKIVLYATGTTVWLTKIATICVTATLAIVDQKSEAGPAA